MLTVAMKQQFFLLGKSLDTHKIIVKAIVCIQSEYSTAAQYCKKNHKSYNQKRLNIREGVLNFGQYINSCHVYEMSNINVLQTCFQTGLTVVKMYYFYPKFMNHIFTHKKSFHSNQNIFDYRVVNFLCKKKIEEVIT